MNAIEVYDITAGYENRVVLEHLNVNIPKGRITMIIGPNGCGKSTLLKNIARIHRPKKGSILLNGHDMAKLHPKDIAKKMALLPQNPITPSGLLVKELVAFGRFPYQKPLGGLHKDDLDIIAWAMKETGVYDQREELVENLSGGQRQRAWIALALAQKSELLVLDEPTTFLDISYQLEILELLKRLNQTGDHTIVMVLHELNLACRFADHMIGMKDGRIIFEGSPSEVVTSKHLKELYAIDTQIQISENGRYPICVDFQLMNHADR